MKVGAYAKSILAALIAGAYALQAAISDGNVTNTEWIGIGTAVLVALGVYVIPNSPYPDPQNPDGVV